MVYSFTARIDLFERDKGWHYVAVPRELSEPLQRFADRGLIAATATVGKSTWPTSLLPMGDGSHFIALPAKIRAKEKLTRGESIEISFELREREKQDEHLSPTATRRDMAANNQEIIDTGPQIR
jgi:hypothetical protein